MRPELDSCCQFKATICVCVCVCVCALNAHRLTDVQAEARMNKHNSFTPFQMSWKPPFEYVKNFNEIGNIIIVRYWFREKANKSVGTIEH